MALKSICAASILALFLCLPLFQASAEDGELTQNEDMARAVSESEMIYAQEQAKEGSYAPPEDENLMKIKEEDRERQIRYGDRYW